MNADRSHLPFVAALIFVAATAIAAQLPGQPPGAHHGRAARQDSVWRRDTSTRDTVWRDTTVLDTTVRDTTHHPKPKVKPKPKPRPKPHPY